MKVGALGSIAAGISGAVDELGWTWLLNLPVQVLSLIHI